MLGQYRTVNTDIRESDSSIDEFGNTQTGAHVSEQQQL